jgi:hypothetical protein
VNKLEKFTGVERFLFARKMEKIWMPKDEIQKAKLESKGDETTMGWEWSKGLGSAAYGIIPKQVSFGYHFWFGAFYDTTHFSILGFSCLLLSPLTTPSKLFNDLVPVGWTAKTRTISQEVTHHFLLYASSTHVIHHFQ